MTTAATSLAATSFKKSWPSNFSPRMAKNKSPGFAFRESVQTFFTIVSAAPRRISRVAGFGDKFQRAFFHCKFST